MPETAAALATEEVITPEAVPAPETEKPPMTREEAVALVLKHQTEAFDKADYDERLAVGLRKGLIEADPSVTFTLAELKELVPLKRDRWTYIKLAKSSHGLLALPRITGRRKKHMTKHQQSIKSTTLQIFKQLFAEKAERLKAVCKKEEIEYLGVPESAVPALGARAATQAITVVNDLARRKREKARRRQTFSRAVNAGIFGNAQPSERSYVNHGGQYGA